MIRITVVIPVYHGWTALNQCLQCLVRNKYRDFRVLIVDHGADHFRQKDQISVPDTLEVELIKANPDLWWTGATNTGIRKVLEEYNTDYIMLLNDDCCLDEYAITNLIECADTTTHSIIAPIQINAVSGKIIVRTAYTAYFLGFPIIVPPIFKEGKHLPYVSRTGMISGGRGALIPTDIFKKIGLFDEDEQPHYGADNDFYLRCKKAGYRLYISNRSKVYVDTKQTTLAFGIAQLTLHQFISTLRDRKSHRNIPDLFTHFRKHYPIPGLYIIGVALNLSRYILIYLLLRTIFLVRQTFS